MDSNALTSNTDVSTSDLSGAREGQYKTVLSEKAINALENALAGSQHLPQLDKILHESTNQYLTKEERKSKSLFQISFVITTKNDNVLLLNRASREDGRLMSTKEKSSIMISISPKTSKIPASMDDIRKLLSIKFPTGTLKGAELNEIHFLGIVKNRVYDKNNMDDYITYYFYVFEARYAGDKPTFDNSCRKHKDNDDKILYFASMDNNLINLIDEKFYADKEAVNLLTKTPKKTYISSHTHQSFYNSLPFGHNWQRYFIIHSKDDMDKYVRPLLEKLKEKGIKYWIEEENATNGEWRMSNEDVLKFCRGAIIIESPNSYKSENVQREVALAITKSNSDENYSLWRYRCTPDHNENQNSISGQDETEFINGIKKLLPSNSLIKTFSDPENKTGLTYFCSNNTDHFIEELSKDILC